MKKKQVRFKIGTILIFDRPWQSKPQKVLRLEAIEKCPGDNCVVTEYTHHACNSCVKHMYWGKILAGKSDFFKGSEGHYAGWRMRKATLEEQIIYSY